MLPLYSKEELSRMNFGLEGKTAIITGGTAGIGNATVEYFLSQGANVVMSGRKPAVSDIAQEMGGSKAVGKYMIENEIKGNIVNVASQGGVIALKRHAAYCASKAGLISLTKVLALEWGEYGIRVNAVSPTVVMTAMGHKAWDGPHGEALKKEMPSGRFAEPEEVAAAIAYLSSSASSMITGHNLMLDGGYTIK